MKEALDLIKKHGATAVLVLWLWHTHQRVQNLEAKLYNCLERERLEQLYSKPNEAVIPKKIEDETKSS
jgi:hypothetical protein